MGTCVGIDVGGTKILGIALDAQGERIGVPVRVPTPAGDGPLFDAIVAVVEALGAGFDAVGVGIPGLVDRTGRLAVGANLPGVVDVAIGAELERRLEVPVTVDNDATCATWAEVRLGAARGADDAVLVTLGTGIGGGIVAGGVLQRGANGFAGEPGHMVVDPNGPPCPCGRRGCWERFASGSGLGRLARDAAEAGRGARLVTLAGGDPELVKGEHVTVAANEGDPDALAVLRDFGWWAALGIANLVNILDPEVVVVGGGLVEAGEVLMEPIREAYRVLVLSGDERPDVRIVPAELRGEAGAIGAALLAHDRAGAA
jgi:glucokinase